MTDLLVSATAMVLITTAIVLFGISIFAAFTQRLIVTLRGHTKDLHGLSNPTAAILPYSPNTLDWFDLFTIVVDMLYKYIPGRCPRLDPNGDGFLLPRLHLGGMLRMTRKDYDTFARSLPRESAAVVAPQGATHPLFLVSLTTPLLLVLLSHPHCPIKPLGAVNTRNRFELANPALCRDATALIAASKTSELTFTAAMGGAQLPGRRKRRGVEFDIVIEVMHKGALAMRLHMSFLQFLSKSVKPAFKGETDGPKPADAALHSRGPPVRVPADAPKRYAAASRDYNPIHTSGIAARLFGFPAAIAHGNHLLVLLTQALMPGGDGAAGSPHEKAAQGMLWTGSQPAVLDATFVKPVTPLPCDLGMALGEPAAGSDVGAGGVAFSLSRKDKLCVAGSISHGK